jgi:hypothetical protein
MAALSVARSCWERAGGFELTVDAAALVADRPVAAFDEVVPLALVAALAGFAVDPAWADGDDALVARRVADTRQPTSSSTAAPSHARL